MTLRIQLLLLAFAILAYLAARWWWLAYKLQKIHNRAGLEVNQGGASPRIDPFLESHHASQPVPVSAFDAAAFPDMPSPVHTIAERRGILNSTIDCMASIAIDAPVTGDFALNVFPSTRRVGSKTWVIEGLNTERGVWEKILPSHGKQQHYSAFQAGIQLVNRNGSLNEVEFSEFVVKASDLAEGLGGTAQFPEMLAEVARAHELEHFTLGHGIRLTLNLHAKRAAWSLPYVQQHAQRSGFVAGAMPGRWVLGSILGNTAGSGWFDMIALTIDSHAAMADDVNSVPIRKLSLTLDVPQVARGDSTIGRPFDVMCDIAIRLCASMEAAILDEQGLAVDAPALERTATELETVYDRLDAAGLSAGSPLAKRLFS